MNLSAKLPKIRIAMLHGPFADLLTLAGIAFVTVGVRDIYRPAAWIIGGVFLLLFAYAMTARRS